MGLARKLVVVAAVEGLVLQPLVQRNQRAINPVQIDYKSHTVRPLLRDVQGSTGQNRDGTLEVHGVIGLLKVASSAYLVSISRRKQVAQIWGRPIYVITGVAIIPVSSQTDAQAAIRRSKEEGKAADEGSHSASPPEDDVDHDTLSGEDNASLDDRNSAELQRPSVEAAGRKSSSEKRGPGIAEEVMHKKGLYGRFTERWFSRRGWNTGPRLNTGLDEGDYQVFKSSQGVPSAQDAESNDAQAYQKWPQTPGIEKSLDEALEISKTGAGSDSLTSSLLPKLIQTTQLLLSSRTFYFSYDYDISRSLATQRQPQSDVPLHRQVDPEYFWNSHLLRPFIEDGFNEYSMPIMQGFVGQREFSLEKGNEEVSAAALPEGSEAPADASTASVHDSRVEDSASVADEDLHDFLLTLISRRSTKRAGLRYLRRGIDEDGNVANAVETEQILSSPLWEPDRKTYSFVQTRGSIPLFFSQLPYSFKPPPVLHATPEANQAAMKKHFSALANRYGQLQAISLVDRHGPEVTLGEAYASNVKELNAAGGVSGQPINWNWFEFHSVCRGMKFENVSILVDETLPFLAQSGFTTIESSKPTTSQKGIVRTNCMDCLDRTNVVQSALAQHILSLQLAASGLVINLSTDPSTFWFNSLWADNGDSISRAYTGTSALKGDYTRTRKRNALGALTDLTLTLSRYYHNLFDDFFAQAVIDYNLGTVRESVFADFEATMTTADPAIDITRARESAISTAANVVVEEAEDLLHGWCVLVPAVPGTRRTLPFAEALLLLSDSALYLVRFDWDARKVSSFERVDLRRIAAIQRGAYITETHTRSQMDADRNVGFTLRLRNGPVVASPGTDDEADAGKDTQRPTILRVNTRSLETVRDAWSITGADGHHEHADLGYGTDYEKQGGQDGASRTYAFKALPARGARDADARRVQGETDAVREMCEEIRSAVNKVRATSRAAKGSASSKDDAEDLVVEEADVLSLEDARRSTGYVESLTYSFKKAIWG